MSLRPSLLTPNPFIKRTCLRQVAYVKRWALITMLPNKSMIKEG